MAFASYNSSVNADSPIARLQPDNGTTPGPFAGFGAVSYVNDGGSFLSTYVGSLNLTRQNPWSLEWWAKAGTSGDQVVALLLNSAAPSTYNIQPRINRTGETNRFMLNGESAAWTQIDYTLPNPTGWHHYVLTRSGGASTGITITLYVDGVQVDQITNFALAANTGDKYDYLTVCTRDVAGGEDRFTGDVSQLAVYATALTGGRVSTHYNNAKILSLTGVVKAGPITYSASAPSLSLTSAKITIYPVEAKTAWQARAASTKVSIALSAVVGHATYSAPGPSWAMSAIPVTLVGGSGASVSWTAPAALLHTSLNVTAVTAHITRSALPAGLIAYRIPAPTAHYTWTAKVAAARLPYSTIALSDYLAAVELDHPKVSVTTPGEGGPLPSFGVTPNESQLYPPCDTTKAWTIELWTKGRFGYIFSCLSFGGTIRQHSLTLNFNGTNTALSEDWGLTSWDVTINRLQLVSPAPTHAWPVLTDQWRHIVFTRALDGTVRLWVDKVLWAVGFHAAGNAVSTGVFLGSDFGAGEVGYDGEISQAFMWDKPLVHAQVAAHFDAAFAGNPGPPIDMDVSEVARGLVYHASPPADTALNPLSLVPTLPQYAAQVARDGGLIYSPNDDLTVPPVVEYGAKTYNSRDDQDIISMDLPHAYTLEFWAKPDKYQFANVPVFMWSTGGTFGTVDQYSVAQGVYIHVGEAAANDDHMFVESGTAAQRMDGFPWWYRSNVCVETRLFGYGAGVTMHFIPGVETAPGVFGPGHFEWDRSGGAGTTLDGYWIPPVPTMADTRGVGQAVPPSTCEYFNDILDGAWHHYALVSIKDPTVRSGITLELYVDGQRVRRQELITRQVIPGILNDEEYTYTANNFDRISLGAVNGGWHEVHAPYPGDTVIPNTGDPVSAGLTEAYATWPTGEWNEAGKAVLRDGSSPFNPIIAISREWQPFKGAISTVAYFPSSLEPNQIWEHYTTMMAGITEGPLTFATSSTPRMAYRPLIPSRVLGPAVAKPPIAVSASTFVRPGYSLRALAPATRLLKGVPATATARVSYRSYSPSLQVTGDPPTGKIQVTVSELAGWTWLAFNHPPPYVNPVHETPPEVPTGPPGPQHGSRISITVQTRRVAIGVTS
jgi:hypothetical protein